MTTLQSLLKALEQRNWLKIIDEPLDIFLEIPHVAYVEAKLPNPKVLLFSHPIDAKNGTVFEMPVVMNMFANFEVTEWIFGAHPDAIASEIRELLHIKPPEGFMGKMSMLSQLFNLKNVPPKRSKKRGECQSIVYEGKEASLDRLPILTTWSEDGGKLGVDATGAIQPKTCEVISDERLGEHVSSLVPTLIALKQYMTHTSNPITLIQYTKTTTAKTLFESLLPLQKHLRIVVFVDECHNDVANPYMLLWRVFNNIDAQRDVWLSPFIGIDATTKSTLDGYTREWPKDVDCDPTVIDNLRKRGIIDCDDALINTYQLHNKRLDF